MKKYICFLVIIAAGLLFATSCAPSDVPSISFDQDNYTVSSTGGTLTIPVNSTGIDHVDVDYREEYYEWEVDPETGDKTPAIGWAIVERVIEDYEPMTRELPNYRSAIKVRILPNLSSVDREARLNVRSFGASATVTITQTAALPLE